MQCLWLNVDNSLEESLVDQRTNTETHTDRHAHANIHTHHLEILVEPVQQIGMFWLCGRKWNTRSHPRTHGVDMTAPHWKVCVKITPMTFWERSTAPLSRPLEQQNQVYSFC